MHIISPCQQIPGLCLCRIYDNLVLGAAFFLHKKQYKQRPLRLCAVLFVCYPALLSRSIKIIDGKRPTLFLCRFRTSHRLLFDLSPSPSPIAAPLYILYFRRLGLHINCGIGQLSQLEKRPSRVWRRFGELSFIFTCTCTWLLYMCKNLCMMPSLKPKVL